MICKVKQVVLLLFMLLMLIAVTVLPPAAANEFEIEIPNAEDTEMEQLGHETDESETNNDENNLQEDDLDTDMEIDAETLTEEEIVLSAEGIDAFSIKAAGASAPYSAIELDSATGFDTLEYEITNALIGSELNFNITGDISFNDVITIPQAMTINLYANSPNQQLLQNIANKRHFISAASGVIINIYDNIVIEGNVIFNGAGKATGGGGGIELSGAGNALTLYGGIIQKCYNAKGGGIYLLGAGNTLTVDGGIIQNCYVENQGAGIQVENSTLIIKGDAAIQNNIAINAGGGIFATDSGITITSGEIRNNTAGSTGGGIYASTNSTVELSGGKISNNNAGFGGGGIFIQASSMTLDGNCEISANVASLYGGGIYSYSLSDTIINILGGKIINNTALCGGGIGTYKDTSILKVGENAVFSGNTASNDYFYWTIGTSAASNIYLACISPLATFDSTFTLKGSLMKFTNGYNNYDIGWIGVFEGTPVTLNYIDKNEINNLNAQVLQSKAIISMEGERFDIPIYADAVNGRFVANNKTWLPDFSEINTTLMSVSQTAGANVILIPCTTVPSAPIYHESGSESANESTNESTENTDSNNPKSTQYNDEAVLTFDGSKNRTSGVSIEPSEKKYKMPNFLSSITPIYNIKWTTNEKSALAKFKGDKSSESDISGYVAVKYSGNATYRYINIAYDSMNDVCIVPAGNDDVIQVFKLRKGETTDTFIPSYLSEDYFKYITNKNNKTLPSYSGFIPDTIDFLGAASSSNPVEGGKTINGIADLSNPYDTNYPAQFDMRNNPVLPAVQDQNNTNLCWDFSAIGAVETFLGAKTGNKASFSQSNMAYALSNKVSKLGFNRDIPDSGNFKMSMAYMTRWEGPVNYDDDPFTGNFPSRQESENRKTALAHVQGFESIPYKISNIKAQIMRNGSVVSGIYVESDFDSSAITSYYNGKTAGYYLKNSDLLYNHAVQIVGWDNNFSANDFGLDKPEINGAWIVKNSWGINSGDGGYIYVSFADVNIWKNLNVVTNVESSNNYDKMYFYDSFGEVGKINFNSTSIWSANVFNTANPYNETLEAVSFYSSNPNSKYEVWVSESSDFSSKEKVATGNASNIGYYTAELAEPIGLKNKSFTVFVKFEAANGVASAPIETNISGYVSGARSAKGQSYLSSDGKAWSDITDKDPDANVCVRAFTNGVRTNVKPYISGYADGTFKPNKNVTRAEAASAVASALGLDTASSSQFTDVQASEWSSGSIAALEKRNCYDKIAMNNTLKQDTLVTKEEFSYILYKALNLQHEANDKFKDISDSYAKEAIQTISSRGIVSGYPNGEFKPTNKITRAEMVVIINKAIGRTYNIDFSNYKNRFNDVDNNHWAAQDIIKASTEHAK